MKKMSSRNATSTIGRHVDLDADAALAFAHVDRLCRGNSRPSADELLVLAAKQLHDLVHVSSIM